MTTSSSTGLHLKSSQQRATSISGSSADVYTSSPPSVSASSPESDSPSVDGSASPIHCTVDSQFSTCNVCSRPGTPSLCLSCIKYLNADKQSQIDSKLKLMTVYNVKFTIGKRRMACCKQHGRCRQKNWIAISEQQNELLKKGTMKPSATDACTLQSVHPVSTSSPKSLTADQHQTDPVIISTQSTVLGIS